LAVDSTGVAYLAGKASVPGAEAFGRFHATPGGLPTPPTSGYSGFLVKLAPAATVLNYATLLGGSLNDGVTGLALDTAGNVYLTGQANSTDFPVTSGTFQTKNKAAAKPGSNAFVSKFSLVSGTNQTAYIPFLTDLGTYWVLNSAGLYQICGAPLFDVELFVDIMVYINQPGARQSPIPNGRGGALSSG
jgi:hypothetical protein